MQSCAKRDNRDILNKSVKVNSRLLPLATHFPPKLKTRTGEGGGLVVSNWIFLISPIPGLNQDYLRM